MATPPTFVAEHETAWNSSTSPKSGSAFTPAVGDVMVCYGIVEKYVASSSTLIGISSSPSLTWTLQQEVIVTDYCHVYLWTAIAAAASSHTVTLTRSFGDTSDFFGGNILHFTGSDGVGASSKTNVSSGAPSLALTTGTDNAAIVAANGDWNAADGTSRTWRTINSITPTSGNGLETTYFRDSSRYTVYGAYWNDAGAAGSKTTGLSAPTGQKYGIAAVEVKGTAGGGGTTRGMPFGTRGTAFNGGRTFKGPICLRADEPSERHLSRRTRRMRRQWQEEIARAKA